MRTALSRLIFPLLLLGTASRLTLASSLPVNTPGSESPMIRCPHCNTPIAAAAIGDYTLAFTGEPEDPQRDTARLSVTVTDRSGVPVKDAGLQVTLSMPEHGHALKPMTAHGDGTGKYWVSTGLLRMHGI